MRRDGNARRDGTEGADQDRVLPVRAARIAGVKEETHLADAGLEAVAVERRTRSAELVGTVVIIALQRGADQLARLVERQAGADIDHARNITLDRAGRRVLVHVDACQQLGRDRLQVERAAARRRDGGAAVDEVADLGQAAHGDGGGGAMIEIGRALAVTPLDLDAGDALERLDRVGVGQLADILCVDRVDDLVGVALDRLGGAEGLADAGDDDVLVAGRPCAA